MDTPAPNELDRLILDSAVEANILPITSRCESGCVFCSHKNNPPGIAAYSVGVRSLDEIARTMAFLNPGKVIAIGESATPIVEGEPFAHPAFTEILSLVRRAHPRTPLEVTTNGTHLTEEMVRFLEGVGNLSLNVSLNSASTRGRRLLMGDSPERAERAIEGVRLLGRSSVRYSGSLVALPHLTGWDDVREAVFFLAANGATAVRVVTPAFSGLADPGLLSDTTDLCADLRRFVEDLPDTLPCPVLLEPSCPSDLTPVASGVLGGSPAQRAGVRRGDVFEMIDGKKPRCRVEAWRWLLPAGSVSAEIRRDGVTRTVAWDSPTEGGAGVTMEYDFDPARAERLEEAIAAIAGLSLLLTSELGHHVVDCVLDLLRTGPAAAEAVAVKNLTFGGTIGAAGLLTIDDYLEAYRAWADSRPKGSLAPAQIILPLETFDSRGLDLKRRHFSVLERMTDLHVVIV